MKKIIVLMLLAVPVANAGIYKWTDSDGNIHFGDRPVESNEATELNITINKKTGITNSSGNKKDREYLLKKIEDDKEDDAEKREKKKALNKKRKKICNAYKRNYQSHIQSNKSYMMSPDGERTYLSDQQRTARKKKLSRGIKKYCR